MDHNKLWKILKEMGVLDHLTCLLRNLYAGQEATFRMAMEQQTGSKLGEEYVKAVSCHPAYLTSFFLFNFIFKLYIIVLVLPNIKMNPPQVYMCSPS